MKNKKQITQKELIDNPKILLNKFIYYEHSYSVELYYVHSIESCEANKVFTITDKQYYYVIIDSKFEFRKISFEEVYYNFIYCKKNKIL